MNALEQLKKLEMARLKWASQAVEWRSFEILRDHGHALVELIEAAQKLVKDAL